MSIRVRLPLIVVGCSLATAILLGVLDYRATSRALRAVSAQNLVILGESRREALLQAFDRIESDAVLLAGSPSVQNGLAALDAAYGDQPDPLGVPAYNAAHAVVHDWIELFRQRRGYQDVILTNRSGDVVYTARKDADFATSLTDGPWRNTALAKVVRRVAETTGGPTTAFSDFAIYRPTGIAAGFVAVPVRNETGLIGVLSLRIPIDLIDRAVQIREGLGGAIQSFVVGPDFLVRSEVGRAERAAALGQTSDLAPAIEAITYGKNGVMEEGGTDGIPVLSAFAPVDLGAGRWALVSRIAVADLLAPARAILDNTMAVGALIVLVMAGIGLALATSIAGPLGRLTAAVAGGIARFDEPGLQRLLPRRDEIGTLARQFQSALRELVNQVDRLRREQAATEREAEERRRIAADLQRSEAELAQKSSVLQGVLDSMRQGVVAFDADLRLVAWNQTFLDMRDYPSTLAQMGTPFSTFMAHDLERGEFGSAEESADVVFQMERAARFERHHFERVRPNGRVIEVQGGPLVGGGFVSTFADVTERNAAEKALRESEARFRAVIDQVPNMLAIRDADGRYMIVNRLYRERTGLDEDTLRHRTVADVFPPDLANALIEQERQMLSLGEPVEREYERSDRHGARAIIQVTMFPVRDSAGAVTAAGSLTIDVTASRGRLEMERLTRTISSDFIASDSAGDFLGRMRNALGDLTRFVDADLGELCLRDATNTAYERRIGVAVDLSRQPSVPTLDRYSDDAFPWFTGEIREGRAVNLSDVGGLPDAVATERAYFMSVAADSLLFVPMRSGGQVVGYVGFASVGRRRLWTEEEEGLLKLTADMFAVALERQRHDVEMREARDEAEQASRAKAAFLATMSHEIRTPMNGVIGMIDLLEHTTLDGDQRQIVRTVRESAFSLLTIIDDILDFSKIEAGKLSLETIPLSVRDIVEGVAETLSPNADKKALRILVFIDPALPATLSGDPVRIRQILFNLIGNAIKFTEDGGGRVMVRVDRVDGDGHIVNVRFSVIDTGIGMSEEQVDALFQPFTQAEGSIRRRFGGTGLGLAICKNLTGIMGGAIEVDSAPGRGSTFTVFLPLRVPADRAAQAVENDLSGLRILALVDDVDLRWIVRRYLEHWRATVELVDSVGALRRSHAARGAENARSDLVVVQADGRAGLSLDDLAALGTEPMFSGTRFIALADQRSGPRLELPNTVLVGLNPLSRSRFVAGVAIAAGRASPEPLVPAQPSLLVVQQAVPSVDEAAARGELILVAEDNPTNQDVIRRQLNRLGYAARIVRDGVEALAALDTGLYALLLTDCHMPNMDGYALTEAIRSRESGGGRHLPVVAITANALQGEAERCLAAGMDDYLAKPIEMTRLREMLKRWMPAPDEEAAAPPSSIPSAELLSEAVPPIDTAALREMFGDDDQTIREILKEFPEPSEAVVNDMSNAYLAHDAVGVAEAAHKLKSSARAVGAHALAALCETLEASGRSADWAALDARMPNLSPLMRKISNYITGL